MKSEKYISALVATGIVVSPGIASRAPEFGADSPTRSSISSSDTDRQKSKNSMQFKPENGKFAGNILLVNFDEKLKPEPTPPPLVAQQDKAKTGDEAIVDKPNVVFKKEILGKPNRLGYYRLYPSVNDSYRFIDPKCTPEHWGSRELIGKIHTVAEKWKKKYPEGHLRIGDLNGPAWEHASHKRGNDFDLNATTNGKDWVGNMKRGNYNQKATIELGKMIADTGKVKFVFFNDPVVRNAVGRYKGWSTGSRMQPWPHHDDHFHVRFNIPQLSRWAPEGKDIDCGVEPGEKN